MEEAARESLSPNSGADWGNLEAGSLIPADFNQQGHLEHLLVLHSQTT